MIGRANRALFAATLAALWPALLAAGCGGDYAFRDDPAVRAIMDAAAGPLALKAGVAIVGMPEPRPSGAERGRASLPPERGELLDAVAGAIRGIGLFSSVEALASEGGEGRDPADEAWARDLDVLLTLEVKRWDVAWRGVNWSFWPNLLLWFQLEIPSWIIRDEDYAVEAAAELVGRSAHTGDELFRVRVDSEHVRSLDDFQRGWMLFGILRVPGALGRSNFERVNEVIGAGGVGKFMASVAVAGDSAMRAAASSPDFARANRKTMAVIAGVQNYSHHKMPRAKFARDDARDLAAFLTDSAGGALPKRNVALFTDEDATKVAVEAALADAVRRSRAGDSIIFHFAGNGAVASAGEGKPLSKYLVCYDSSPDDLAMSSLCLDHVLGMLSSARGKSVALIDASFRRGGGERSFSAQGASSSDPESPPVPPRVSLVMACGQDQECGVFEDRGRGFFSWFLMEALRGAGDSDRDGKVGLGEAFRYAKREVEVQAFVDGFGEQSPFVSGAPLDISDK